MQILKINFHVTHEMLNGIRETIYQGKKLNDTKQFKQDVSMTLSKPEIKKIITFNQAIISMTISILKNINTFIRINLPHQ